MESNESRLRIPLSDLFRYSDNCRSQLREVLLQNRALFDRPIEPPLVEMRSIRHIVSHMAAAEERWIKKRILGLDVEDYEGRAAESVEGVFADWESIRANTRSFLSELNPEDFGRVYTIALSGRTGQFTVEQVVFQFLNHETHHRAQVSMALQQFGIDPPNFDFAILK